MVCLSASDAALIHGVQPEWHWHVTPTWRPTSAAARHRCRPAAGYQRQGRLACRYRKRTHVGRHDALVREQT
jgi:hypothetical protein